MIENEIEVNINWSLKLSSFYSGQSAAIQVPQPIFVHTGPAGYQPQYFQQQAPSAWNPTVVQNSEVSPMLPAPSAPPRPQDFYPMEHPPPAYEKLYTKQ